MSWLFDFLVLVVLMSPASEPCEVLDALDARREASWAAGDRQLLGSIYVDASADLELFDEWAARGLRVESLALERAECQVVDPAGEPAVAPESADVRVRVVERVGSAVAVASDETRRELPADHWSERDITLTYAGLWQILAVE